jgi:STIP1 homology and U-box containing protein 1
MSISKQVNSKKLNNSILKRNHFRCPTRRSCTHIYRILSYSRNDPKVFANRALTRIRLNDWLGAECDARKCIELHGPKNNAAMKGHYYLAQALLAQRHVGEARDEALIAYKMCLETRDASADLLSQFVLRAKQAIWQSKETSRLREVTATLGTVEELLERKLEDDIIELEVRFQKGELGETGRDEEQRQLESEAEQRRRTVREVFEDPKREETKERVS